MTLKIYSLATTSEIGDMGEHLSQAVRKFAEGKDLSYDLWHQDAPVWVISDLEKLKSNIGRLVHKLEMAVFHTDYPPPASKRVVIIPDAYKIDKGVRKTISPDERQNWMQHLDFDEFCQAADSGYVGTYTKLQSYLAAAWDKIVVVQEANLK